MATLPVYDSDALLRTGALPDDQAWRSSAARAVARPRLRRRRRVELDLATPAEWTAPDGKLAGPEHALVRLSRPLVSDEIIVSPIPASARAEPCDAAHAGHLAAHRRRPPCRRGVRPVDGSGHAFIAGNLAAALAQVGIKTLLVDANLRVARLDGMFGLDPNGPGLTT
jgi:hypothetical protein